MIRNNIIQKIVQRHRHVLTMRFASTEVDLKKLESEETIAEVIEDAEAKQREEELERKRNKSGLREADYRKLHDQNPYPEPQMWFHGTVKYLRRTYGKYGAASGVDPAICFPLKEELKDAKEYESIKYPYNILEVAEQIKVKKEEERRRILERQEDIAKKVEKLDQWKQELNARIEKKESEALAARARKERLIEEVRRHFGYKVDPKDDRFKELLEKKEKEEKKAMKEARKKVKEEEMLQKLLNKGSKKGKNDSPKIEESAS